MKTYKYISIIIPLMLIAFIGCKQETYSFGELTTPANLQITATVVGKSAELPNGDGSGVVNFTFSANDVISYKVDFGDGSAPAISQNTVSKKYNKVGTKTYRVLVTAIGRGGITTTSSKEITVYYAYQVTPDIVTLLTGDSPTGKKWRVDKDADAHFGLGPGPGRPDGNPETFVPSWWSAAPNSRADKGIYDDVYTFTNTKVFTHQTNGTLYGYKAKFATDFDPATPGVYGGYGDEWILSYPDYTESFDYDGDPAVGNQPERVYITFERRGHAGFFMGSHKYMILEITPKTMWLRGALPGTNDAAWYVKLIAVE